VKKHIKTKPIKTRKNAHKRSRNKRPNAAFPFTINPFGDDLSALTSVAGNVAIFAAVQNCTINEKLIIGAVISSVLVPVLKRSSEKGKTQLAEKILNGQMAASDCVCKGDCLCHTGMQIAGVPCPPECPNAGKFLDGCHRCDCGEPKANGESSTSEHSREEHRQQKKASE
jgi:hypothetical protein